MDAFFSFFNQEVPAWVVTIMAIVNAVHMTISFWSKIKRFGMWLQQTNYRIVNGARRWLGVTPIKVHTTQESYDAAPDDDGVIHVLAREPQIHSK